MHKSAALYYTNLIDKLEMTQNYKPDDDISHENTKYMIIL